MYVGLSEFIYSNQTGTQIACQQVHFGAQARGVATRAKSWAFSIYQKIPEIPVGL